MAKVITSFLLSHALDVHKCRAFGWHKQVSEDRDVQQAPAGYGMDGFCSLSVAEVAVVKCM